MQFMTKRQGKQRQKEFILAVIILFIVRFNTPTLRVGNNNVCKANSF